MKTSRVKKLKGRIEFGCESGEYPFSREQMEKLAKDFVGKSVTIYTKDDFKGERKVVGKVIEAHVVGVSWLQDHIDYEVEVA
jgi:hypothetical protein